MAVTRDSLDEHGRAARLAAAALQVVLGVFTPLALLSLAGVGVYAAPALLPLLWIAARAGRSIVRWYLTALAALVAGEVVWAITWSLAPSLQPVAVAAIAATFAGFTLGFKKSLDARTSVLVLVVLGVVGLAGVGALAGGGSTVSERSVRIEAPGSGPAR